VELFQCRETMGSSRLENLALYIFKHRPFNFGKFFEIENKASLLPMVLAYDVTKGRKF